MPRSPARRPSRAATGASDAPPDQPRSSSTHGLVGAGRVLVEAAVEHDRAVARGRGARTRPRAATCRSPRRRRAATRPRGRRRPRGASSSRGSASSARPTKAWRAVARLQRRRPAARPARPARCRDGRPPDGGRVAAQQPLVHAPSPAGPGAVPSSSRSRRRSSSNTRSASAGLPAASWTSISSRCADSRNGAAATAARAACSAAPSSRRAQAGLGEHLERAQPQHLERRALVAHPRPVAVGQEGRRDRAVRACRAAVSADRQAPSCSAASARRAARAASSTSTPPPRARRAGRRSARPARRRRARGGAWTAAR